MLLALLLACHSAPAPEPVLPFEQRPITPAGMARAFPAERVKDPTGWATDLRAVFDAHHIPATNGDTCVAVATIEQESGYAPNPTVPGIGGMIDTWITEKQASMNKVEGWAFEKGLRAVLDTKAPGQSKTFYERLHAAKTERDVDVTFRAFVAWHRAQLPKPLRAAASAAQLVGLDPDDWNPITTAGCMQVKVDFAKAHARDDGDDPDGVRDALYTRAGCLHYGVVRLLGWEAGYDKPLYRFADYNLGEFASRNAAFQEQVAVLAGTTLPLDGDLLRYEDSGRPSSTPSRTLQAVLAVVQKYGLDLSESRVRRDLAEEKQRDFEDTDTWKQVRALYEKRIGRAAAYARLPDVHLASIKLAGDKTTAWYAQSVDKRYQGCLARLKG